MPIEVTWDDAEQSIFLMKYDGAWTWQEFHRAGMAMDEMINGETERRFDIIVDVTEAGDLPSGALAQFGGAVRNTGPNIPLTIIAGSNLYVRSLIETFRKINPKAAETWQTAKSVDEARAMIARSRATNRQES